MVNRDRDGVEHPEQTQEGMIPTGYLAGTTPSRTITGEPETQSRLVWNQTRTAGKQKPFEQNQHSHMDLERVDVVDHKIRRTQRDRHHGNFATHRYNSTAECIANGF